MLDAQSINASTDLIIYGAGGLASKLLESVSRFGLDVSRVKLVADDAFLVNSGDKLYPIASIEPTDAVILAVGKGHVRKDIMNRNPHMPITSMVLGDADSNVQLDVGILITEKSYVQAHARLGKGVLVNDATIGHHCDVGDWCTFGPNAVIGGGTTLGSECSIGMGALVREKLRIVGGVKVGMGAVVVKDIVEPGVYIGNPARKIE